MKLDIPMPSEQEKQAAIAQIVAKGYKSKRSVFSLFAEMKDIFAFRNLFFGVGDCICLTLMIVFILYTFLFSVGKQYLYTCIFTSSPVLYLTAWLLTLRKEYFSQTLELQNVCKYTPVHITALRLLFFSLLSMLADIPVAAIGSLFFRAEFANLLLLSFCSLFLYAVLQLIALMFIRTRYAAVFLPFLWAGICLLPIVLAEMQWEKILQSVQITVLLPVSALLMALYWYLLGFFIRKGNAYAESV